MDKSSVSTCSTLVMNHARRNQISGLVCARASAGSSQQPHAPRHSHAALCTSAVTLTPRSRMPSSNKRPVPPWSILCRDVSLAPSPASLLITSRGIQQPSRPSHHTTQSNTPPTLPAVYIHSRRASSSAIPQRLDCTCLRHTGHKRSLLAHSSTCPLGKSCKNSHFPRPDQGHLKHNC
jgi:hypothetical protein